MECLGRNTIVIALKGTDNFFCGGKSGNKIRDFPNVRGQYKGSGKAQASGSNEAPKKNHFYTLRSRGEKDTSPDVVTGMLKVFSIDGYSYLILVLLYHFLPL